MTTRSKKSVRKVQGHLISVQTAFGVIETDLGHVFRALKNFRTDFFIGQPQNEVFGSNKYFHGNFSCDSLFSRSFVKKN